VAHSKFRTHYGRARHHPMVTRRAVHHHGFLTRFHRPVTGTARKSQRHDLLPKEHKTRQIRSVHPGHVITRKAKKTAAARKSTARRSTTKLAHTKIAGGHKIAVGHRATGIHATGHTTTRHRRQTDATRAKISRTLTGKHHPHRGHAMSTAARHKIAVAVSARLKGRPHPHRGHSMSNAAREKISRALKAKAHTRRTARAKRR
jgi:hypothetical protein